jgi:hypothetical protein
MDMKHTIGLVSTVALLSVAGSAEAVPRDYRGSDTLEKFTVELVARCGATGKYPALAAGEFRYIGGGSTGGGTALAAGTQDLAPMSRALNVNTNELCHTAIEAGPQGEDAVTISPAGSQAEQWAVALDGIVLTTSAASASRCVNPATGDANFPASASLAFAPTKALTVRAGGTGAVTGTYTFANWRDVVRVLYAGADSTRAAAQGGAAGQTAANRVERCSSDIRRSLVADWDNVIQGSDDCGTVAGSCQNTANVGSGGIRHLLRRDDISGTTDTFLSLMGLASVGGSIPTGDLGSNEPFCNGRDHQDLDPIRIACTSINPSPNAAPAAGAPLNDEICGPAPTVTATNLNPTSAGMGLVNAISVPTQIGTTNGIPTPTNTTGPAGNRRAPTIDELYPTQNCLQGVFEFRRPPRKNDIALPAGTPPAAADSCPDGGPFLFSNCLTPVAVAGDAVQGNAHCVNSRLNNTPGAIDQDPATAGVQRDGRVWNQFVRAAAGSGFTSAANQSPVLRNERGRDAQYSTFRLRVRDKTQANGAIPSFPYPSAATQTCRQLDATQAIGCLSRTAECTIGFAGREAVTINGAAPLLVGNDPNTDGGAAAIQPGTRGIGPSTTAIRQPFGGATETNRYQLSRRLYVNSLVGLENIGPGDARFPDAPESGTPEAFELAQCLTDPADDAIVLAAINAAGFVSRLTDNRADVICEEFNESRCTGTVLADNDPSLIRSCP